jgi:hypothetical protein
MCISALFRDIGIYDCYGMSLPKSLLFDSVMIINSVILVTLTFAILTKKHNPQPLLGSIMIPSFPDGGAGGSIGSLIIIPSVLPNSAFTLSSIKYVVPK